ncbi:hypothetical protein N7486_001016 [Penicillium sp. IBT 16267x]|nr:hypothetical protein N7486_001016 [Penicillium sp. IBT 16267x]
MMPRNIEEQAPAQSSDKVEDWSLQGRCGMTDTDTFFSDQKYLFLDNIYSADEYSRESMTSFAVKRNTFRLFFCDFENNENMPDHEPLPREEHLDLPMSDAEQIANTHTNEQTMAVQTMVVPSQQLHIGGPISDAEQIANTHTNEQTMAVQTMSVPSQQLHLELPLSNDRQIVDTKTTVESQQHQIVAPPPSSSRPALEILAQSSQSCRCKVNLTPQDLYASIPSYVAITFYDIEKEEALFFRGQDSLHFLNLIEDHSNRWYAMVEPESNGYRLDAISLVDLTKHRKIKEGNSAFVCHAMQGCSFYSLVFPTIPNRGLKLPHLNSDTGKWELVSENDVSIEKDGKVSYKGMKEIKRKRSRLC